MSSILTNSSAISALQNLATTQKSLQTVQGQISTGLRIATAEDNASYWSIASTMKSDNGVFGVVKSALAQGQTMVSTAYNAVNSSIDVMNTIKQNLVAAKQPGADLAKIQGVIAQASKQLQSIVDSSAYNGQNWLNGSQTADVKLVAAFNRADPNSAPTTPTSVGTIDIQSYSLIDSGSKGILQGGDGAAYGTSTLTGSTIDFTKIDITKPTAPATSYDLDKAIGAADTTLSSLQTYGANLGATQNRLKMQADFITKMSDALTEGVGALVDADMNEASTKLQALQTQQQLGVQSLSIANQNTQMIMKLFG